MKQYELIARLENMNNTQDARIAELEAALKNLVDMCTEHPAVYGGSSPIKNAIAIMKKGN